MIRKVTARNKKLTPTQLLSNKFGTVLNNIGKSDAVFCDSSCKNVIGITGLQIEAPVIQALMCSTKVSEFVREHLNDLSVCFAKKNDRFYLVNENGEKFSLPDDVDKAVKCTSADVKNWAGYLTENGEHVIDLKKPSPGPHFYVNLLIGNRLNFPNTLQTTPKSVVDRFGGGSFRSHAATQVLATRYDMRQEENGFPANRQFYLYENGRQIFYSASADDSSVTSATCVHSCNRTVIRYKTACDLEITRTIFLIPHKNGFPLATELQEIEIKNNSGKERKLDITYTGMFGTAAAHAVFEDVTYTNVIMQSSALYNDSGEFIGISPDYCRGTYRDDARFVSMFARGGEKCIFPKSFCTDYNSFVGSGTLERPEYGNCLNNKLNRRGPGFFALGIPLAVPDGETVEIDTFTGLSSRKSGDPYNDETMQQELENLLSFFKKSGSVKSTLDEIIGFQESYCEYLQFKTGNQLFDSGFNKNLAFQILYQTFMSRSFCQTQKGYREIGFREIQDLYASMYYFINMGYENFVRDLLFEWTANVYKMGYANHNFYWCGKQPGLYSDDSLWLLQAYHRYIVYTGDTSILDEEVAVAGENGERRAVRDTLVEIIRYSACISIGEHGLPLLDFADWNDCLKIDTDFIDGAHKEKLYLKQLKETGGKYGDRFKSDYSESVMNAFLLKVAEDCLAEIAAIDKDTVLEQKMKRLSDSTAGKIQKYAWKEDFFARVLINRYNAGHYSYIGAKGDGLSACPGIDGAYFLNSFSWSVLSETASDEQIKIMLETIKKYLLTPFGLKLITPANLNKLSANTATDHYFYGDRENGAVFKHASMMAAAALAKSAKTVKDKNLAEETASLAYFMIDLVMPYKNLDNPFVLAGNPRICTQYINSDSGENIGPLLSGTATWLNLSITSLAGIEYAKGGIYFDPILRDDIENLTFRLKAPCCRYAFSISKPKGFARVLDSAHKITIDGSAAEGPLIPLFKDEKEHCIELTF